MKTAIEIPDAVYRLAKARATERGVPLRQFVTEAVEENLSSAVPPAKPWAKLAGGLRHLHKETLRIDRFDRMRI